MRGPGCGDLRHTQVLHGGRTPESRGTFTPLGFGCSPAARAAGAAALGSGAGKGAERSRKEPLDVYFPGIAEHEPRRLPLR